MWKEKQVCGKLMDHWHFYKVWAPWGSLACEDHFVAWHFLEVPSIVDLKINKYFWLHNWVNNYLNLVTHHAFHTVPFPCLSLWSVWFFLYYEMKFIAAELIPPSPPPPHKKGKKKELSKYLYTISLLVRMTAQSVWWNRHWALLCFKLESGW